MKAMILAAGLGTRLQPFTLKHPKVLLPIADYTLLEITIRYLKKHGISELIINVHHFADQVIKYLEKNKGFGLPYTISDECNTLMNTGGGLVHARQFLEGDEPFVLTSSDVLTGLDLGAMLADHNKNKPLATLAVKDRPTSRSLLFNSEYQLTGWRNNESGEVKGNTAAGIHSLGFSTIHIIEPRLFNLITETGAFNITDMYLRLMATESIRGFRHDDSDWIEFGRTERLRETFESERFKKLIQTIHYKH